MQQMIQAHQKIVGATEKNWSNPRTSYTYNYNGDYVQFRASAKWYSICNLIKSISGTMKWCINDQQFPILRDQWRGSRGKYKLCVVFTYS